MQARLAWYQADLKIRKIRRESATLTEAWDDAVHLGGKEGPEALRLWGLRLAAKGDEESAELELRNAAEKMNRAEDELEALANEAGEHGGSALATAAREARTALRDSILADDEVGAEMLAGITPLDEIAS